jgi:hypothetical protein
MSQDDKVMTTKKRKLPVQSYFRDLSPHIFTRLIPVLIFTSVETARDIRISRSTESVDVTDRGSHQGVIVLQDR